MKKAIISSFFIILFAQTSINLLNDYDIIPALLKGIFEAVIMTLIGGVLYVIKLKFPPR
jgi:hypothetical protein